MTTAPSAHSGVPNVEGGESSDDTAPDRSGNERPAAARYALFRPEAVDAYVRRDLDATLLRVTHGWLRSLLVGLSSLVAVLLVVAAVVRVEVTSVGPAVLRSAGGAPRVLVSQVTGTVLEVTAQTGDAVHAGDVLLRIDSTQTKREAIEAAGQLDRARAALKQAEENDAHALEKRTALLEQQVTQIERRRTSQSATIERYRSQAKSYDELLAQGHVSAAQRDEIAERLAQAMREESTLAGQVASLHTQRAGLEADHQQNVWHARQEVDAAVARTEALRVLLDQSTVRAPMDGYVESLLVHIGDAVQTGSAIAHLVPSAAPAKAIAFLPERDRAYLQLGADVRIELDQLPLGDSPPLRAKVVYVAREIAAPRVVSEALGDDAKLSEPSYRVELEVEPRSEMTPYLRAGMLGNARFVLRKRHLLGIAIAPLRAWLDS